MKYFEDFTPGDEMTFPPRSVTEEEIIAFAKDFDPQPFHIDREAASRTPYGGIIASGWHTMGMMMRLMVDHVLRDAASMGSPGIDELRWLKPVRPGDVLTLKARTLEAVPSKSRPDRGMVTSEHTFYNQHGEAVAFMRGKTIYGRRPAEA